MISARAARKMAGFMRGLFTGGTYAVGGSSGPAAFGAKVPLAKGTVVLPGCLQDFVGDREELREPEAVAKHGPVEQGPRVPAVAIDEGVIVGDPEVKQDGTDHRVEEPAHPLLVDFPRDRQLSGRRSGGLPDFFPRHRGLLGVDLLEEAQVFRNPNRHRSADLQGGERHGFGGDMLATRTHSRLEVVVPVVAAGIVSGFKHAVSVDI